MIEGWPEDIAMDTFRGLYEHALRANCPMGQVCRLAGVAIHSVDLPGVTDKPTGLVLVSNCAAENCPVEVVFGVAGEQAIQRAQEIGLITGGTLTD